MRIRSNKTLWISLAAGGSLAVIAFYARRRNSRRSALPDAARGVQDRSSFATWRFDHRFTVLPAGKVLRFALSSPAIVHWTVDQWDTVHDTATSRVEPGLHVADLPTQDLNVGTRVQFTFHWREVSRWEGEDFEVKVDYARQYAT